MIRGDQDGLRAFVEEVKDDDTLPEQILRYLRAGARLQTIVLDEEGVFWHEGQAILHPRLSALFHRSIDRSKGGTWVLCIPPYTYPIQIMDTPYHVRSLRIVPTDEGEQVLLRLSDGTEEPLDVGTLCRSTDPDRLYCEVKGRTRRARFSRVAYHALCERIEERGGEYLLRLDGEPQPIPARPD